MSDTCVQIWHHALTLSSFPAASGYIRASVQKPSPGPAQHSKHTTFILLCHQLLPHPPAHTNGAPIITYTLDAEPPTSGCFHLSFSATGRLLYVRYHGSVVRRWTAYVLPSRQCFLQTPLHFMVVVPSCSRCLVICQACRHNHHACGVQQILDLMRQEVNPVVTLDSQGERIATGSALGVGGSFIGWLAARSVTLTSMIIRVRSIMEVWQSGRSRNVEEDVRQRLMRKQRRIQLIMLLAVDVALGFLLGQLGTSDGRTILFYPDKENLLVALNYQEDIASIVYDTLGYSLQTQVMKDRVAWVMRQHAPMGFKLNERLDTVLGTMVILAVDGWHLVASRLASYVNIAFYYLVVLASYGGGASFLLSLSYDAVSVLTLHVKLLYVVFARMYRVQLRVLSSLFKLLRGKKQNVLRNRVDHCDYDKTQLLAGSIIFIVCLFLLQTSLAYYIMFSTLWALIVTGLAFLWWCIALSHTLPLYSFCAHAFASSNGIHRASDGIRLVPIAQTGECHQWKVESKPTTLTSMLATWLLFCFEMLHSEFNAASKTGVFRSFASGIIVHPPPLRFRLAPDDTREILRKA